MGQRMQDQLVTDAFKQAYQRESPKEGLIVHTDQGSQYTSSRFQELLRQKKCKSSMSRKGNPYDNALMESFYKTLKESLSMMLISPPLNKLSLKFLNILRLTITRNVCTPL